MEFKQESKKKPTITTPKSSKIVLVAILILTAISGFLLFNKVLYDRSVYSYNPKAYSKSIF